MSGLRDRLRRLVRFFVPPTKAAAAELERQRLRQSKADAELKELRTRIDDALKGRDSKVTNGS